jgi:hypothetical protein
VLFVHGHGLYSSDWDPLIEAMQAAGYPPSYLMAIQIQPNTMGNVAAAERVIAPAVERLLARVAEASTQGGSGRPLPRRIAIVAHSMGAVSSRWYTARLHPERVAVWVGLAGSNHGTNALCPYPDEAAREMCPAFSSDPRQQAVQIDLNGRPGSPRDASPYGIGDDPPRIPRIPPHSERSIVYYTVRIEPDEWIVPARSAVLEGAGGPSVDLGDMDAVEETSPGNYRFDAGFGWLDRRSLDHMTLLEHPELHRLVLRLLETGR